MRDSRTRKLLNIPTPETTTDLENLFVTNHASKYSQLASAYRGLIPNAASDTTASTARRHVRRRVLLLPNTRNVLHLRKPSPGKESLKNNLSVMSKTMPTVSNSVMQQEDCDDFLQNQRLTPPACDGLAVMELAAPGSPCREQVAHALRNATRQERAMEQSAKPVIASNSHADQTIQKQDQLQVLFRSSSHAESCQYFAGSATAGTVTSV